MGNHHEYSAQVWEISDKRPQHCLGRNLGDPNINCAA